MGKKRSRLGILSTFQMECRNPASAVVKLVQPRTKNTQKAGSEWADKIIAKAGQVNDCLQQLLLPLLDGWLGAMAYICEPFSNRRATVSSAQKIKWSGTYAAGWAQYQASRLVGSASRLALTLTG